MLDELKRSGNQGLRQFNDFRNVALYLFLLILLAITWSSVKTIQQNYELQRQIARLQQENNVTRLQNQNINLQNKYYASDQYLELTARQSLGLAAPGEQVLLVPKKVSAKYMDQPAAGSGSDTAAASADNRSKYVKNLETWRDFLLGRQVLAD